MLEKITEKVIESLPVKIRWRLRPRGIIAISSTRPGELDSDPNLSRLSSLLGSFIAGGNLELPDTTIVSEAHILDGGWLHPVKRLATLEEEQGLKILGLEWVDEGLRSATIPWCGREMKREPVRAIFAVPDER